MFNFIWMGADYLFPAARGIHLFRTGGKVVNSTSPLMIAKNVTLTVVDCCCPPTLRLAAHCIGAGAVIAASVVSPNPLTIGSSVHLLTEIYDNC